MQRERKTIYSAEETNLPEIVKFEHPPKIISAEEHDLPPVDRSYMEEKWKIMDKEEVEQQQIQIWQMPEFETISVDEEIQQEAAVNDDEIQEEDQEVEEEIEEQPVEAEEIELEELPQPVLSYPTAAEIEQIHKEAYQQGYDEGFALGQREGLEQGRQQGQDQAIQAGKIEFETEIANIIKTKEELIDQLVEIQNQIPSFVVKLAVDCAQKILSYQLKINDQVVVESLKETLSTITNQVSKATIRINPADLAAVEKYTSSNSMTKDWTIKADPSIHRGGGKIESEITSADFSLETRWQSVIQALGLVDQELNLPAVPKEENKPKMLRKVVKKVVKKQDSTT